MNPFLLHAGARRRSCAQTPPAPGRAISASRPLSLAPLWAQGRELVPRPSGHCGWRSCLRSARPQRASSIASASVALSGLCARPEFFFCAGCMGFTPRLCVLRRVWRALVRTTIPPRRFKRGAIARQKRLRVLAVVQLRTRVGSAP